MLLQNASFISIDDRAFPNLQLVSSDHMGKSRWGAYKIRFFRLDDTRLPVNLPSNVKNGAEENHGVIGEESSHIPPCND